MAIKKKTNVIKAKYLMSDDCNTYYNAWRDSMGAPEHKLLCSWHVQHSWEGKVNQLLPVRFRKLVLFKLFALQSCTELSFFHAQKIEFYDYLDSKGLVRVKNYFENYYYQRVSQWALCYRKGMVYTNNHLESMHS